MITHKFREVIAFADDVSILRRGEHVGGGKVADLNTVEMATMMIGERQLTKSADRIALNGAPVLAVSSVMTKDRSGLKSIAIDDLTVRSGEIVGVAGVSGNGQTELMEILTGQRPIDAGTIMVKQRPFRATRAECQANDVRYLPEEPLRNACSPQMSVAENISFRRFDTINGSGRSRFWLDGGESRRLGAELVAAFKVKTSSLDAPISSLSGGNVQRAVLARELSGEVELLVVSNPCFGLDFSAVAEIRARIIAVRNAGAAVLLISEDLDEILELSDRVLVMSEGRIAYETPAATADIGEIGRHMAGHR
jgi:simple sugar transport system ATP-binding protein